MSGNTDNEEVLDSRKLLEQAMAADIKDIDLDADNLGLKAITDEPKVEAEQPKVEEEVEPKDKVETQPNVDGENDKPAEAKVDEPEPKELSDEDIDKLDNSNAVVLAKDGKHQISFDKLKDARESAKVAKAQAAQYAQDKAQLEQEIARLQAAANQPEDETKEAPKTTENIMELFGDFSEESIAKGVETLVNERVAAALSQVNQSVADKLKPIEEQQVVSAEQQHYNAIMDAHPDAASIGESMEFAQWIASKPSYVAASINNIVSNGSSTEVVEMLNDYKRETNFGKTDEPEQKVDEPKAKEPEDKPKDNPNGLPKTEPKPKEAPDSLSDVPNGSTKPTSEADRLDSMSPVELAAEMRNWDPSKIEAFLNRRV